MLFRKNDEATTNGTCTPGNTNCVEWGLEYPLDGLNFNCSSDTENTFITLFDSKNGVASEPVPRQIILNFIFKVLLQTRSI